MKYLLSRIGSGDNLCRLLSGPTMLFALSLGLGLLARRLLGRTPSQ